MNLVYRNFKLDLREDGIAIFSANRPAVKNAMNIDAWQEFHAFLREAQRDDDIRVIILTGEGDAFISGADITEFQKTNHTDVLFFDSTDVVQLIEAGRKPVIAAVNGGAYGGGFEVALACDLRVVSESAVFALPETGIGMIPGMGGTQRLCKVIGAGRAKEVILGGRRITGPEAVELGLAMVCVPPEQLMAEALRLAGRIMRRSPNAVALVKRCMNLAYCTDDATGLMIENLGVCTLLGGRELDDGAAAFLEKRKPDFWSAHERREIK